MFTALGGKAVEPVAAGEAFNAARSAALCEGKPFELAIKWGLGGRSGG